MERLVSKATGQFRKPSQVTVHATLCICQLLWAGMHIVVNGPLDHLEPFCFAMTRIGLALPFLAVFAWHERPSLPSRKELAWVRHALTCSPSPLPSFGSYAVVHGSS